MANTQKIQKTVPAGKSAGKSFAKKMNLATFILGYIAFALLVIGGVSYIGVEEMTGQSDAVKAVCLAIVGISQLVTIAFGALLIVSSKKLESSKQLQKARISLGSIIIAAICLIAIVLILFISGAVKSKVEAVLAYVGIFFAAISQLATLGMAITETVFFAKARKAAK